MRNDRPSVEVNGRLWHEVQTLAACCPTERVYSVVQDEDGSTRIVFGDGIGGERLPAGEIAVQVRCYGLNGPVDLTARVRSDPRFRSIRIQPDTVRLEV